MMAYVVSTKGFRSKVPRVFFGPNFPDFDFFAADGSLQPKFVCVKVAYPALPLAAHHTYRSRCVDIEVNPVKFDADVTGNASQPHGLLCAVVGGI